MKQYHSTHIPVSQFHPEFTNLREFYRKAAPKTVLEIGSQHGGTLWYWMHEAEPGTKIVNIDPLLNPIAGVDLVRMWQSWATPRVSLKTMVGMSYDKRIRMEVLDHFDRKIEWCFIDGDHTYRGAYQDFYNYGRFAKIIVFHDLVDHLPHFGVGKLFRQLQAQGFRSREFWSRQPPYSQAGGGIGVIFHDRLIA